MMSETQGRRRASRQILLVSLWLTLVILAMKVWIGWATQSLSLVAGALHTLMTSFSILLSLIAVSSPYAVNREVWGHSRLESTMAFLIIAFMGFACTTLLVMSTDQLEVLASNAKSSLPVSINAPLLQLLAVVTVTNFCLAVVQRYQAGTLESSSLRLNASYLFQDCWLMVLILLGLVGVWRNYVWLDPFLGICMVGVAFFTSWRVFNRQLPSMIEQVAIAPESIAQAVHQVEGITHCYNIQTRGIVGRYVIITMRLILHPEYMSMSRPIAERVERFIRDRYGPVRVVIYIDSDHTNPPPAQSAQRR